MNKHYSGRINTLEELTHVDKFAIFCEAKASLSR